MTDLVPATALVAGENAVLVYLASLPAATSRRAMISALKAAAKVAGAPDALAVAWHKLDYGRVVALRSLLMARYAPATCSRIMSALRGVFAAAFRLGQMSLEDYTRVLAACRAVSGETLPAGRHVAHDELELLAAACTDAGLSGVRDLALIACLYAGLRRAEVAALQLSDYEPASGRLAVNGKGRKQRAAFLSNGGKAAMAAWLSARGNEEGALFLRVNRWGKIERHGITAQAVYLALIRRTDDARLAHLTPHDLRRSFVSDLMSAGSDTLLAAKLAGHSSPQTTMRYDRRPEQESAAIAARLPFPQPAKKGG